MAYTRSWNAAAEASPADSDNVSAGAGKIREFKVDVRERIAKDHYFDTAGTDADHGEHKFCTLREQSSKPTVASNKGAIYTKDVSGVSELFYENDAGTECQMTTVGAVKATGFATINDGNTGTSITWSSTKINNELGARDSNLATHKTSSDHDGRYYTESEVASILTSYYSKTEVDWIVANALTSYSTTEAMNIAIAAAVSAHNSAVADGTHPNGIQGGSGGQ